MKSIGDQNSIEIIQHWLDGEEKANERGKGCLFLYFFSQRKPFAEVSHCAVRNASAVSVAPIRHRKRSLKFRPAWGKEIR